MARNFQFAIVFLLGTGLLAAQAPPKFEAASIRPNRSGAGLMGGGCRGTDTVQRAASPLAQMANANVNVRTSPLGRCVFTNVPLSMLVELAYGGSFSDSKTRMTGGPKWLDADRYDVEAVAPNPADTTTAQLYTMLQALLADRVQLKIHRESRPSPGYVLLVARSGAKLQQSTAKEEDKGLMFIAGKPLSATNASMTQLANFLAGRLGRPVADETGLNGGYDFTLRWLPGEEEVELQLPGGVALPPEIKAKMAAAISAGNADAASLFTALQDQLGLRLEQRTVPVEFLVIDTAEKPSEN